MKLLLLFLCLLSTLLVLNSYRLHSFSKKTLFYQQQFQLYSPLSSRTELYSTLDNSNSVGNTIITELGVPEVLDTSNGRPIKAIVAEAVIGTVFSVKPLFNLASKKARAQIIDRVSYYYCRLSILLIVMPTLY